MHVVLTVLLEKVFCKTSLGQFAKKKEEAWLALIKHFFGDDRATTILSETNMTKLRNTSFSGPRRYYEWVY